MLAQTAQRPLQRPAERSPCIKAQPGRLPAHHKVSKDSTPRGRGGKGPTRQNCRRSLHTSAGLLMITQSDTLRQSLCLHREESPGADQLMATSPPYSSPCSPTGHTLTLCPYLLPVCSLLPALSLRCSRASARQARVTSQANAREHQPQTPPPFEYRQVGSPSSFC